MDAESTNFVRAKLENYTEATCSSEGAENNRVHYYLRFTNDVGWAWLYSQVNKLNNELTVNIELWKIKPSGVNDFEIDVREIERREGVDEEQRGLSEFSR